eukprot:ctg_698.g337
MVPGPTNVPQRVQNAMHRNSEDHRSLDFPKLGKTALEAMKRVFMCTRGHAFIFPGTGTLGWEAALSNTLSPGDRVVTVRFGQFSHLWADMMQRLGLDVIALDVEWGEGPQRDIIERLIREDTGHRIQALCVVHNETTTGVTSDIPGLRAILDRYRHPALYMVDGVSSIGADVAGGPGAGVRVAQGAGAQQARQAAAGVHVVRRPPQVECGRFLSVHTQHPAAVRAAGGGEDARGRCASRRRRLEPETVLSRPRAAVGHRHHGDVAARGGRRGGGQGRLSEVQSVAGRRFDELAWQGVSHQLADDPTRLRLPRLPAGRRRGRGRRLLPGARGADARFLQRRSEDLKRDGQGRAGIGCRGRQKTSAYRRTLSTHGERNGKAAGGAGTRSMKYPSIQRGTCRSRSGTHRGTSMIAADCHIYRKRPSASPAGGVAAVDSVTPGLVSPHIPRRRLE